MKRSTAYLSHMKNKTKKSASETKPIFSFDVRLGDANQCKALLRAEVLTAKKNGWGRSFLNYKLNYYSAARSMLLLYSMSCSGDTPKRI